MHYRAEWWLLAILRDGALETEDRVVFGGYLTLLGYELDRQIEEFAPDPAYEAAAARRRSSKGISTQAAMVLVTEIRDFRRFEPPGKLMAYVGLVPTEHSIGCVFKGLSNLSDITVLHNSFLPICDGVTLQRTIP